MSIKNWPGGRINKTPPTPSGPYENSTAPGVWTLDQQAYWQKQGQWPTAGSVDPSAFIENLFSTYLYTGTSGSNTITNGIDLSTKGGLVWVKSRSGASSSSNHILQDTVRGANKQLRSNTTGAEGSDAVNWAFNSSGFSMNTSISYLNDSGTNYVSWTFREQPKFFDVVTYTGDGAALQYVPHNLGSEPGCIIVKKTSSTGNWIVWHRSISGGENLRLNTTVSASGFGSPDPLNINGPVQISVSAGPTADDNLNDSGATYVAYLFAHNAGGFGLTGTDNVISCGSFTTDGSGNATVDLGYEPQWLMIKDITASGSWYIGDVMRGFSVSGFENSTNSLLAPNNANAEFSVSSSPGKPTANGFTAFAAGNNTHIYIAIRRGPMKTPTTGTSVFNPTATTATTGTVINAGFPVDAQIIQYRTPAGGNILWQDRLRGVNTNTTENNNPILTSNDTSAESNTFSTTRYWDNTGYQISANLTGQNRIYWNFRRAPGFFDEVCYTGTGSALAVNHNLGVAPELVIWKARNQTAFGWKVTCVGLTNPNTYYLTLNSVNGETNSGGNFIYNRTATTVTFSPDLTQASYNNVVYLFASAAGVSKVGSYTGTGILQTIPCGFAAGARFVLIKRVDSTGDWYVWDSARGISSGNDPYLLLNSTAAEVTGTNYVDTTAVGFQVTAAAPGEINAVGGTFIFLAVS